MKWALVGAVAAIGIFLIWQRRSSAANTASGLQPSYAAPPPREITQYGGSGAGLPPNFLPVAETYTPAPAQRPNVAKTIGCAGGAVGGAGVATYFGAPQLAPFAGTIGCSVGSKIGGLAGKAGSKIGSGVSTVLKKLF